jgi:hypothetical protein
MENNRQPEMTLEAYEEKILALEKQLAMFEKNKQMQEYICRFIKRNKCLQHVNLE